MDLLFRVYRTSKFTLPRIVSRSCSNAKLKDGGKAFVQKDEAVPPSKEDQIINAIGTADELSSFIGFAREFALDKGHSYSDKLTRIQTLLVDIKLEMSNLSSKQYDTEFFSKFTKEIEEWTDEYGKNLQPKEKYILPGGGKASASLHVARNICDRAERTVRPLVKEGVVDRGILTYFDKLGKFLLTAARYAAKAEKRTESVYSPHGQSESNSARNKEELKV